MPADKKTRERTEGAATAVQAKLRDSCSANQVDPDPMCLTSFGDDSIGPPALPCSRNDALVGNGAAAPKSCLSPLEMRTATAAGGLLPAGTTFTATRTTSDQPHLWGGKNNQQAPFWPTIIETKSGQNLVFDLDGSTDRLRVCPFLGTWRALLCGGVIVRALDEAAAFFGGSMTRES